MMVTAVMDVSIFFYGLSNNLAAKAISYNYLDNRLPLVTVFTL